MGYHPNLDQNSLPKWSHGNSDGGGMTNNNSGARVVEVASPELHSLNERVRRPSGPAIQGRPGYPPPSSTNPSRMMLDKRRYVCVSVV